MATKDATVTLLSLNPIPVLNSVFAVFISFRKQLY